MGENRIGRQTPTRSYILPYLNTKGQEAIDLYNRTGKTAQEWQELLLVDILATNEDKLWTHMKFGYAVPRRNGKNEIIAMREMYGLIKGEHILHTAHRVTTTHSSWERLYKLLELAEISIKSSYKAFGKEHILLETGGKIDFRTRTSKGGLGEGFDLLIIDEAQEYQDDQESALKYVVSDSDNPQTLFCGTPPTPVSSGTVFTKLRNKTLAGNSINTGWAEWSVENQSDVNDIELWYKTNPSLGTILTERKIQNETTGDVIDFNIQRLGLWIKYNQKSAISQTEWANLKITEKPELTGNLFVGIKYSKNGKNVALSIACKTKEHQIFIESYDCQNIRNGNLWILEFLKKSKRIEKVVIDGANGQETLSEQIRDAKLKKPTLPTVKDIIVANSIFETAIFTQDICHNDQLSLTQVVTNCDKRAIGTNGGFGYKSLNEEMEIALLDSVILAYWACKTTKPKKKQSISY